MPSELSLSIAHCRDIARRAGSNFYFTFLILPRDLRRDMCVLYAFMRHTDDFGDDESQPVERRRQLLHEWRSETEKALSDAPAFSASQILPALRDLVARRGIPTAYLLDVISGVESDLTPRRFETYSQLEHYCYQVAGAVGLCCIRVWGCRDEAATPLAIACGQAFQLTNILRDLVEDARRDRYYLPTEDFTRFGVSREDLLAGRTTPALRELVRFEADRARDVFASGAELFPYLSRPGRRVLSAMFRAYGQLLDQLAARDYDVCAGRPRLARPRKVLIALQSYLNPNAVLPRRM
jgi:phytoene synthase